jgi:hypothetical protein
MTQERTLRLLALVRATEESSRIFINVLRFDGVGDPPLSTVRDSSDVCRVSGGHLLALTSHAYFSDELFTMADS